MGEGSKYQSGIFGDKRTANQFRVCIKRPLSAGFSRCFFPGGGA
ncbi:hypothetical protein CSC12_1876 [Klebsiella michiganensis]|nr:hypothetical protein CSC12_1876 [Klebsiella michiganensis]